MCAGMVNFLNISSYTKIYFVFKRLKLVHEDIRTSKFCALQNTSTEN